MTCVVVPIPKVKIMHKRLNDFMYLIDLKPRGFENFSASYVIKGRRAAIVETGPRLTVENLLAGLNFPEKFRFLRPGVCNCASRANPHF